MKLEWTIQYGRLVADRFESMARNVKYVIEPDENGWGAKAIRVRDGMKRIDHTPTRMPLQELVEWCERDAECPAQPAADECLEKETSGKMSGKMPSLPDTMDANVWDIEFFRGFGLGREMAPGSMAEWFQAALSHGFREGQASVYELVDRAQRQRDLYGPVVPGTRAPEPPSVEERLAALEAGQKAAGKFWEGERLSDMNFVLGRLEKLEAQMPRPGDASLGTMHEEVCKRLTDLEAGARAHEGSLSFHDKRLEKLEAKP